MAIKVRGKSLYVLMQVVSGLSFCMYGYDAGVIGGLLLHTPFQDAIGNPTGPWIYPMIVAVYDLAAFFTSIFIATFTMKIGRRGTIIMANIAAVIGSVIQAAAYSVEQLIVGRIVTGFAIASISSSIPTYLVECATQKEDRGPAHAVNAMFLIGGVPLAYWIDYGFTRWHSQASWRIPIIFQCLFAIPALVIVYFLPDTPRWYYAKGRSEEGDAVLSQLYDQPVDSQVVQDTRKHILTAIEVELEANSSISWQHFLTMGVVDKTELKIIRRLVICFWLPMFGEWMGISLLAYFTPVILQSVGLETGTIAILSGVMTTLMALGTVPVYWTIERLGRRWTMLSSGIATTILYAVFIALVAIGGTACSWAAVGVLFTIVPILSFGFQATKFLYSSEIAPLEYRHIGGAFFSSGEWLMVFITVFASPIGLAQYGWPFWFFILVGNVLGTLFVWLFCPETAGKTLEQVDYLFIGKAFPGLSRDADPTAMEQIEESFANKRNIDHFENRDTSAEK